jgi:hypothetical protein
MVRSVAAPGTRFQEEMAQMEQNREQIRIEGEESAKIGTKPTYASRQKAFEELSKRFSGPVANSPVVSFRGNALRAMMDVTQRAREISKQCVRYKTLLVQVGGQINRRWRVSYDLKKSRFVYKHPFCYMPACKQLREALKNPPAEVYDYTRAYCLAMDLDHFEKKEPALV